MRRFALLFVFLLVCLGGVSVSSASWTASWSVDLGPGYITTSPVTDDERVYVRTSGFWTGEERPEVRAFDHQGELQWTHRHPTTTQHDMSPLLLVSGGTGPCGSWPDLLLVGWANGQVEALHPSNATVVWSINTTVDGWGVTGAMLLDGDRVVVPTRSGLARACLEDGVMDLNVNLSLGWRNGVAKTDDAYWMGSETGHLWKVSLDGRDVRGVNLTGQLRHAPIHVNDLLLLHVQQSTSSSIHTYDLASENLTLLHASGSSPAIPIRMGETVVFGDSDGLTSVQCNPDCRVVDHRPTKVNGEMAATTATVLFAPVNSPGEGWIVVEVGEYGMFSDVQSFSTPHDGFGTSAPAVAGDWLFLGNDAGVLMAYSTPSTDVAETASLDGEAILGMVALTAALGAAAWCARAGTLSSAWRVFSLSVLIVALMMLPEISQSWSAVLVNDEDAPPSSQWDDAWPETWLGTQIVVFELPEGTLVSGGLVGHENVWGLTQAAATTHGLAFETERTSLGLYVVSINQTTGSGWEYFLNGERGVLSVDEAGVDSTVVVHWRLA